MNPLKARLAAGETIRAAWAGLGSPDVAEIMVRHGWPVVVIDDGCPVSRGRVSHRSTSQEIVAVNAGEPAGTAMYAILLPNFGSTVHLAS